MKIKLSKKTKTFLSVATAIIASTAVTTLLTSCSSAKQSDIVDTGGYDKEYGINDVTYARMEEDFKTLYKSQLDQKKSSGEIDDSTYNLNLSKFQNNLNSIHASLYSDENKTLSYTIRTNVLRDYARNNYGIRLSRQSNVSLSVTISGIKNSIVDSVLLLCKEYKIADADTNKYRENAEAEFEKLYTEAKSKYAEDDVVSIVQYIQNGMVDCFKGICKELDCLAAQQQLKDFIGKYQINVKENLDKNYYWDKLLSKYKDGKEISVEDFNSIFTMTYEETDPQSSSSSYFSTTKKTKEFRNNLITGYTLKPILVKMNSDPKTNVYSIDVDYTLVNNNYKDDEKVAELTAHSSHLKDKSFYEDENISIFDLNANESEREYTNYILPITEEYEKEQINKTYFNNEDFKFTWSTSEEYGYDDFWTKQNEDGEYKGKLDVSGLAASGMMINGVLLIDILNQAGKISLSGGSYQLNGIVKKADKDAKQWKLTINGEVVDKDAIQWKLISPINEKELPDSIKINDGVVSWTDKIETGSYNFSVLAIYKETKIQTPSITLTISSSEQSENVENFNHAIKNMLYDEDTIDQKLLNFVKNVDFSLDYTENDYDTEIEDHKKGEILINNIIIGYKNSENKFSVSDSNIKQAISNAINNDSGVTARFSNNLYKNIKGNYLSVGTTLDILKIIANEYVGNTSKDNDNLKIKIGITLGLFAVANVAAMVTLLFYLFRKHGESSKTKKAIFILIVIVGLIAIGISNGLLIFNELNINSDKIEKIENLKKQWDKPAEGSDKFFQKISDDQKYFISTSGETDEKCKEEFNNLSISKVKEKKWFYEQCKTKPTDYEENPDKYKDTPYGMFRNSMKKFDEVNNILVDVSWRFNTVIIIDCIVFTSICVCLISAIRSYNKNVARLEFLDEADVVKNGLSKINAFKEYDDMLIPNELDSAIADKKIIIREADDFNNIPDFKPEDYNKTIVTDKLFGKVHYMRIKCDYDLSQLIWGRVLT